MYDPDDTSLEFRDGRRVVPPHLYPELKQLKTYLMTYDEAVKEANAARERRFLGDFQHSFITGHFDRRGN